MLTANRIPRIFPLTEESKRFSITGAIYALAHPYLVRRCDALVIMNGRDEGERLRAGLGMWQETTCFRLLLLCRSPRSRFLRDVTQANHISHALYPHVFPQLFERTKEVFVSRDSLENTKAEVLWVADCVHVISHESIRSVAFLTSPEHIERVYRTFVRQFGIRGVQIPFVPVNTQFAMPPGRPVPDGEDDGKSIHVGWDYHSGEEKRLSEFEGDGDVASYEEMREYLNWLFKQPITRGISCI